MKTKLASRKKRKIRIRAVVSGTRARPRLAFYRSHKNLYVQLIDDESRKTIIGKLLHGKNTEAAQKLGTEFAALAKKKSVTEVVFDRGGNRYHGVVKAFADATRKGGLKF